MCLISLGQGSEEDGEELARLIPGKFLANLEWIIFLILIAFSEIWNLLTTKFYLWWLDKAKTQFPLCIKK